ncbi:MAG: hypothetical protein DCF15_20095 [Phormidesmis priestleyi]|uniref:Uncharacterized protein n=1 Tax=Phormidesmis priestleyi TaxID=268141 RepID=A0A2W4WX51_9CYAN|nr:MAG: hypothetical protein DCF15_20095 [Phormidesmis priestleyi]
MRGLSLIGLLVACLGGAAVMLSQIKPSSETEKSMPVEGIEKANGAAQGMDQQAEQLQKNIEKLD